jgi:hypothetical protein
VALTQEERVAISAKIAAIPDENKSADESKATILKAVAAAQSKDNTNKNLMDAQTALINPYQQEIERLDGNGRSQLLEADILNAAKRLPGNFFFLNQPSVPTPTAPDGLWKLFPPFLLSRAIGKTYTEGYTVVADNETTQIAAANTYITTLLSKALITRVTGQSCTPGTPDVIDSDAPTQTAMTNLIAAVNSMVTAATAEQAAINAANLIDTDGNHLAENATALTNITTLLTALNAWLAHPTFNTAHGQATCAGFNGYNASLLFPTKGDTTNLAALQTALSTRSTQVTARITQVSGYLGSVTQSTSDGSISGNAGYYLKRAGVISLRLNTLNGSLTMVQSLLNSANALDQLKNANTNANQVYDSLMTVYKFKTPTNGTASVQVDNGDQWRPKDQVYIVSDTQPEMTAYVKSKDGNRIILDRPVPPVYTISDNARMYRLL